MQYITSIRTDEAGCAGGYPAPADDYNLRTISDIIQRFGLVTGLTDHTLDNTIAINRVAMGASIIEKHITLNRNGGWPDDSFSVEPAELAALCKDSKTAWAALGRVDYGRKSSEQGNVWFRRSLHFVKDLKAGDVITSDAVRRVRPGFGLELKYYDTVPGKRINCDAFVSLDWDLAIGLNRCSCISAPGDRVSATKRTRKARGIQYNDGIY